MTAEEPPREDWAAQLTEKLGEAVGVVRDETVGRVQKIVSAAIFGVLAVSLVVFIVTVLVVGLARLLNEEVFDGRVWATYFLLGGIFVVAGTLISTMRHSRS